MKFIATLLTLMYLTAPLTHAAECSKACPAISIPVCGSNNKTYDNKCLFEMEKCKTNNTAITIVKNGTCSSAGTPECSLEFACLDVIDPVCGSDGITYDNSCVLKKAQCVDNTIQKAHDGPCKNGTTSAPPTNASTPLPTTTKPSSHSTSGSGSGTSVTCVKGCTKEINYVCGSDGVTYANPCLLEEKKQCGAPTLTKAGNGECNSPGRSTTPVPSPTKSAAALNPTGVVTWVAISVFARIMVVG